MTIHKYNIHAPGIIILDLGIRGQRMDDHLFVSPCDSSDPDPCSCPELSSLLLFVLISSSSSSSTLSFSSCSFSTTCSIIRIHLNLSIALLYFQLRSLPSPTSSVPSRSSFPLYILITSVISINMGWLFTYLHIGKPENGDVHDGHGAPRLNQCSTRITEQPPFVGLSVTTRGTAA